MHDVLVLVAAFVQFGARQSQQIQVLRVLAQLLRFSWSHDLPFILVFVLAFIFVFIFIFIFGLFCLRFVILCRLVGCRF